jgi:hypothetical protein
MKPTIEENLRTFHKIVSEDKVLKTITYIGIGVLSLYVLSKAFNGLAVVVRSINNIKSAINGN